MHSLDHSTTQYIIWITRTVLDEPYLVPRFSLVFSIRNLSGEGAASAPTIVAAAAASPPAVATATTARVAAVVPTTAGVATVVTTTTARVATVSAIVGILPVLGTFFLHVLVLFMAARMVVRLFPSICILRSHKFLRRERIYGYVESTSFLT